MKVYSWPTCIIGFFVFIVVINVTMLCLAIDGYGGLLDQHPYEKGLTYDVEQQEMQRFLDSGISVQGSFSPISLTLKDLENRRIDDADVSIDLLRPNDRSKDRTFRLSFDTERGYFVPATIESGRWIVTVRITRYGKQLRVSEQVIAEKGKIVAISMGS